MIKIDDLISENREYLTFILLNISLKIKLADMRPLCDTRRLHALSSQPRFK